MRFEQKSVVVTGGTSGLGEMVVKAFVREGANVMFCGLIDAEGERVVAEATADGAPGTATYMHADVRHDSDMHALVDSAVSLGGKLDIAFNNAGISHHADRMPDQDLDMVKNVFDTNIMGIWHAMRHELKVMEAQGYGAIINTSSILSKSGAEWMAAYGTSKHAVVGLTKSAALDYAGTGIRINAISPGPMRTPMFERALADIGGDMSKFAGGMPATGPADPMEVAGTVLHIASDEASYMNGANVVVDGGTSSGYHG